MLQLVRLPYRPVHTPSIGEKRIDFEPPHAHSLADVLPHHLGPCAMEDIIFPWCFGHSLKNWEYRSDLLEVPPHIRLIDA